MTKFNLAVATSASEKENLHAQFFREIALILKLGLGELGHEVFMGEGLRKDSMNIILGYHLIGGKKLPPGYKYIIYQLEQLSENGLLPLSILNTLKSENTVIWDFTERNVEFLAEHGIDAIYKPIGFHPLLNCVQHCEEKDVDVLFYGSRNPRRIKILSELNERFNLKVLFGIYGKDRDHWIARSKIVIALHYYETKYFDDVRLTYLLNNKAFTVVEDTPHKKYENFLIYTDYDRITETCGYYLEQEKLREKAAHKAFSEFSEYPEAEFLKTALAQMERVL